MKKAIRKLIFSAALSFFAQNVIAQCYDRFFQEGIEAYDQLDFDKALKKFRAADICEDKPADNKIELWLEKAKNGYELELANAQSTINLISKENQLLKSENRSPEELIFYWREKIKEVQKQTSNYNRARIRNNTSKRMYVAFFYKALDGQWVTEGWYIVDPGSESFPEYIITQNDEIYFHAHTADGHIYGQKDAETIEKETLNDAFTIIDGVKKDE